MLEGKWEGFGFSEMFLVPEFKDDLYITEPPGFTEFREFDFSTPQFIDNVE